MHQSALIITTVITAAVCLSGAPAQACYRHTFDPCPATESIYQIGLDAKTGRTWIKAPAARPIEKAALTSESGRLATLAQTAAENLAPPSRWTTAVRVETAEHLN